MNEQDKARIAKELGIPPEYSDMLDTLTIEEIKTRRCEDCQAVIEVHADARWRFRPHVIRCEACIEKIQRAGYSSFEARYVC